MRAHQCELVDVLQRPAALEHGRRRAPDHDDRRLRELGVLHGRDRVREPGPGRDDGHARDAGQSRRGVRSKYGRCLVAGIHDADVLRARRGQDRRDVPAAQGEDTGHPVRLENLRYLVAAVHARLA